MLGDPTARAIDDAVEAIRRGDSGRTPRGDAVRAEEGLSMILSSLLC